MSFEPITTQEDFDARIQDRLVREAKKIRGEFSDYEELKTKAGTYEAAITAAQETIAGHEATIRDLTEKTKRYETDSAKTRIALAKGLPYEMASRLTGETEEEITADAESLQKLMAPTTRVEFPMKGTEPEKVDRETAAFAKMLDDLSKGD